MADDKPKSSDSPPEGSESPAANRRRLEEEEQERMQEEREGYAKRIRDQADKAGETPKKPPSSPRT